MQNRAAMPSAANNSGIRDNPRRGLVADFLRAKIKTGSRLSVVSAYFTIYAYEALKGHLDKIDHLDFLFGEPRFISSLDPEKTEKKTFILDGNGRRTDRHSISQPPPAASPSCPESFRGSSGDRAGVRAGLPLT